MHGCPYCHPHGPCRAGNLTLRKTWPGDLSQGFWASAPGVQFPKAQNSPSSAQGHTSAILGGWSLGFMPHRTPNTSPLQSKKAHTSYRPCTSWPSGHPPCLTTWWAQALQITGSPPQPDNFSIWPETQTKDCYFPPADKESSNLKNSKAGLSRRVKEKAHTPSFILISQQSEK